MPSLKSQLDDLVRIPSIAAPGRPRDPLVQAHHLVAKLLRRAGAYHIETLDFRAAPPVIFCEISPPVGAPTVLLYGHYDVAPADEVWRWATAPFEPTERRGAIFGRGTSRAKSNLVVHLGALEAWEGRPPVGVKIVIEGQGELPNSALASYARAHPALFRADAVLTTSPQTSRAGLPTVTTTAPSAVSDDSRPAHDAAIPSVAEAWGIPPVIITGAASGPAMTVFAEVLPRAEIVGLGPISRRSEGHTTDECLVLDAFERTVVAEAKFFRELAVRARV